MNLELEFHWLVVEERESTVKIDLSDEPQSSINRHQSGNGYGPFIRRDPAAASGFTPLISGTRFTMSTDDPVSKLLLDPGLLERQWHMQRVLAMSGAARWRDKDFDDDDDDEAEGVTSRKSIEHWRPRIPRPSIDRQQDQSPPAGGSEDSGMLVGSPLSKRVKRQDTGLPSRPSADEKLSKTTHLGHVQTATTSEDPMV
ncbi:hypothetical protein G6011_11512 [Alternaria panax]|uniref:Uncharacterized protein n=1 Tax=Alternaria panax TaxID=48097 RepID=A0AAD4IDZ8_9PLEO|nr:hypothetical protein G6011_11512 [Alternaria panax]